MNDTLVIDLETKKALAEVGGEANIKDLGISVAGVYSYAKDIFFVYEEHELPHLEALLSDTVHVIGFNIIHFDLPVLKPYMPEIAYDRITVTDMFADIERFLGHRLGLGVLAKATLGENKSGKGLEALQWFREGRIEDVKKYCLDDVRLTKNLYEFGKAHGHVLYESRNDGKIHSIPVPWGKPIEKSVVRTVEDAFHDRKSLAIEYVSSEDPDGLGYKKMRVIDVYKIKKDEIEAFCHLRQNTRMFRVSRIMKAEPLETGYVIPQDVQGALF